MIIFIKPTTTPNTTYYIAALFDPKMPMLKRVAFLTTETEIIDFINQANINEWTDDYRIMFDGTYHAYTGMELRRMTEHKIFIYRESTSGNLNDPLTRTTANAIAAQAQWIKNNMHFNKEMQTDPDYLRFLQLLQDYNPANTTADTSASELMAAAARYLRKTMNN